jgi:predicted HAD superfamily phosphohydrolase YqeG
MPTPAQRFRRCLMRRTPRVVIDQRAVLISLAAELQTRTLVVDVEPLLNAWDATAEVVITSAIAFANEATARIPSLQALVFATNAKMSFVNGQEIGDDVLFISAARKPWRTDYVKGGPGPVTVIGDQLLTDGLLARRLGGTFLHWRPCGHIPAWPRMQTFTGKLIENVFFARQDLSASRNIGSRA